MTKAVPARVARHRNKVQDHRLTDEHLPGKTMPGDDASCHGAPIEDLDEEERERLMRDTGGDIQIEDELAGPDGNVTEDELAGPDGNVTKDELAGPEGNVTEDELAGPDGNVTKDEQANVTEDQGPDAWEQDREAGQADTEDRGAGLGGMLLGKTAEGATGSDTEDRGAGLDGMVLGRAAEGATRSNTEDRGAGLGGMVLDRPDHTTREPNTRGTT